MPMYLVGLWERCHKSFFTDPRRSLPITSFVHCHKGPNAAFLSAGDADAKSVVKSRITGYHKKG